ncbi:hypothetical protein NNO_1288 [Hydrogenimonas sp.]|nr:hypothetical protein NNO_1288 [Hydrogenimonas sp.]
MYLKFSRNRLTASIATISNYSISRFECNFILETYEKRIVEIISHCDLNENGKQGKQPVS